MLLHAVARSTTLQIISRDFVAPPQGPQWPDLALLRIVGSFENLEGEVSCNPRDLLQFLPKSGIEWTWFFFLYRTPMTGRSYCHFQDLHTNKQTSNNNYRLTRFEEAEKGNPKQRENERTLNKKWTQKKGETPKPFPLLCYDPLMLLLFQGRNHLLPLDLFLSPQWFRFKPRNKV